MTWPDLVPSGCFLVPSPTWPMLFSSNPWGLPGFRIDKRFSPSKETPENMGLGQKGTWPTVSFRWYISFQEGNYLHYNHDFSLLKYRSKSILNFKGTPHAFPNKQVVVFLDVLFSSFWILRHKSLINIPHVSVGKYIGPQFRVHFPASHGHVYQRSIRPWIPWSVTPGCF